MTNKEKLQERAKQFVGEVVILKGGGSVANELYLLKMEGFEDGRPVLVGEDSPTSGDEFRPRLGSWRIYPVREDIKQNVPLGNYYVRTDKARGVMEFVDAGSIGIFGSILQGETVAEVPLEASE